MVFSPRKYLLKNNLKKNRLGFDCTKTIVYIYYEINRTIQMEVKPTESELEILSILWTLKEASVRQIHEKLAETKATGYTRSEEHTSELQSRPHLVCRL